MKYFHEKYPEVIDNCISINNVVKENFGFDIDIKNISFDLILPFLFSFNNYPIQCKIALELRLYREIIDYYNSNKEVVVSKKISDTISIPIISLSDYKLINKQFRVPKINDLYLAYLVATKRVFYRFLILNKYKMFLPPDLYFETYNLVKEFSAFLLFDDDVFDLDDDFKSNKKTILTQFLISNNHDINSAIELILSKIEKIEVSEHQIFDSYIKTFISIYHE